MTTMATRAPPPGLPAKVASVPPNQTLYVTNLPSAKIQKGDLRTALYMLFSTYGAVLDVVALKTMKMRGQAHIVYKDIQTATQAMRSLDGFEFFGQEMVSHCSPSVVCYGIVLTQTENLLRKVKIQHHCQAGRHVQDPHRLNCRPRRGDRPTAEHLQCTRAWGTRRHDRPPLQTLRC
jgi:hypothetical protein